MLLRQVHIIICTQNLVLQLVAGVAKNRYCRLYGFVASVENVNCVKFQPIKNKTHNCHIKEKCHKLHECDLPKHV